jgi:ubiquinone/menaquinone biosynthesis C-methylase UbiE
MAWFVPCYDAALALTEASFLRQWRAELVGDLRGRVLEIGAGTGLNLPHYRSDVDLVLTEPSDTMRARLILRAGARPVEPHSADALPYPDGSFETVVCTLVLCTVPDPEAALREVHRVLRPGGALRFIEHVASDQGWVSASQRALEPMWAPLAGGCHLCRRTAETIAAAGFVVGSLETRRPWSVPPFLHPFVRGVAVRAD